MSLPDQILASRRKTWEGVSKLLFWGTAESLLLTLIVALHAIQGPSWGLLGLSIFLQIALVAILAVLRR